MGIYNLANNVSKVDKAQISEQNNTNTNIVETDSSANIHIYNEIEHDKQQEKTFDVAFLGELMMGGQISQTLNYNYMSAFKSISEYTTKADYTVVNLGTNVIDLDELKNTKSKYIVTKSIENALSALGVDGINVANDHMLDFGKEVFQDTINLLRPDYDLIGLKDTIIYAEQDGIKIAIIGVCNEVIGSEAEYIDAGIMMYNLKSIKSLIKEAKKNVNTVVVTTHLGLENTHVVTDIMAWFYRELINAGADAVLGSHALGLYPVEIYNGKPIIYSMGNLMSDTDYLQGKESGIFTLNINQDGQLKAIEITPLYINAKRQTILYSMYNKEKNESMLEYLTSKLQVGSYKVLDNKVEINIE